MEKKEARIKCPGCSTSYKLRIPVTEKPVSFKCKKCGKVLKIKIASALTKPTTQAPPQLPAEPSPAEPQFETTQLPDESFFGDQSWKEQQKLEPPPGFETHSMPEQAEKTPTTEAGSRKWIVLSGDVVKGPFTDEEMISMIHKGDVTPDTSVRMGERPWIKAGEIGNFREHFSPGGLPKLGPLASMTLLDADEEKIPPKESNDNGLGKLLVYPVGGNGWKSLAIFFGIAFALSTVLFFEHTIGLPLSIVGWMLLFGYLAGLMHYSSRMQDSSPPEWDFSQLKDMLFEGVKIFAIFFIYSKIPVTVFLLLMITFFLNGMPEAGYLFMGLTLVVFAASLFVIPASLVIFEKSSALKQALNIKKIIRLIKLGGRSYLALSGLSIAIGFILLAAALAAVFLVDIPDAGFLLAGLVTALFLSYAYFIWFHALGKFSGENSELANQVFAQVSS